jgi:hypothetical protein
MPVNLVAPTRELKRPPPASRSDKNFASSVRPPPLPSMRVRKGTVERDGAADDDEWALRAACVKARLLVAERETQLSAAKSGAEREWDALRARARATEEREWEVLRARVRVSEEREWEELRARAHAIEAHPRQELRAREPLTAACILDRDSQPRTELGRAVFWP